MGLRRQDKGGRVAGVEGSKAERGSVRDTDVRRNKSSRRVVEVGVVMGEGKMMQRV